MLLCLILPSRYGESIGGKLIIGMIAWPHEWVIVIGAFLSTLGAGLQSITGMLMFFLCVTALYSVMSRAPRLFLELALFTLF